MGKKGSMLILGLMAYLGESLMIPGRQLYHKRGRQRIIVSVQRASQVYGAVPSDLSSSDRAPLPPLRFEDDYTPLLSSPLTLQVCATLFWGLFIYLGPDGFIAPLGLESKIRPGTEIEFGLAKILDASSTFVTEREKGFAAEPSLVVRGSTALVCLGFGAGVSSLLVRAFDDPSFVLALGVCAAIASGVYEVGRAKPLSRVEAEEVNSLETAFLDFAQYRLRRAPLQNSVHKTEIIAAFRLQVPRYRTAELSGVSDREIYTIARRWHYANPTPGAIITPAGFFKACVLLSREEAYLSAQSAPALVEAPEGSLNSTDAPSSATSSI